MTVKLWDSSDPGVAFGLHNLEGESNQVTRFLITCVN